MTAQHKIIPIVFLLLILILLAIKPTLVPELDSIFLSDINVTVAPAMNETEKDIPIQYPFKVGEKLHYGIYSAGIRVGKSTITYLGYKEINGRLASYITFESEAPGFYDIERIYGDIENSLPVRIEREIRLFGKDILITEEYAYNNKEVIISRKSKETTVETIKSSEVINNIILLLYQFRYKFDYKIGEKMQFNLPTKRLEVLIDSETKISVPDGKYKAIYIRSIPSQFKVWVKNDKDRIPLRIQGAIGFGKTYLSLLEVDQPE